MKRVGMNMEGLRARNRALVLDYINSKGPVSRTDISSASGLTAASVTQITTQLIAEGIIKEIGTKGGTGAGRRRVLLDIDPSAAYVMVVSIELEETVLAVCDLKGRVVGENSPKALIRVLPTDKNMVPEDFISLLCAECNDLKKMMTASQRALLECVSVATTGIVDTQNILSVHAYGIWDRPVDIGKLFGEGLGLPVLLENNVDAFAIAELMYGIGRTRDNLFIIKWGPGVGSTIIIDDKIYKGRRGKTAELGHFIVDPNGRKCSCGRRGCLETKVSYNALNAIMPFAPEDFESSYSNADPKTRSEVDSAIDLFARCIVNAGTLIAPSRIVLVGRLFKNRILRDKLISACSDLDSAYGDKRIFYTALSDRQSYVGPAAVFAQKMLSEHNE